MRAIFFDMGGVLIKDHILKEQIFKTFVVNDREAFWRLFNDVAMPACRGEESLSDCWRKMAAHLGITLSEQIYNSLWIDDFRDSIEIDQEVLAIIAELSKNYRLGVVSNTIAEHATILRSMGVYDHFAHVVLSHEVGFTKDNPSVFDLALSGLNVSAHESIFIDDVQKFVDSAASKGMKSIQYKSPSQLRASLREYGVKL